MIKDIKVTKHECFDVSAFYLNALISKDFYEQDDENPIVMTVYSNSNKEMKVSKVFKDKDDALDYFVELEELERVNQEISLH